MKRLLLILVILAMAVTVNAADLRFEASIGADGYNAYWGTVPGEYPNNLDLGDVTEVLDIENTFELNPGTTYFIVKAYNAVGESDASNVAEYAITIYEPPADNLPIKITRPATITIIIE